LERHSLDDRQQPISYDRLQVADLAVNLQNGALSAGGPGWINRVFINSVDRTQNQLGARLPGGPAAPALNNAPSNPDQLNNQLYCLHVCFQGSVTGSFQGLITGKTNQGELTFNDQIRAACAPVFDWSAMIDPKKQEKLGPKSVTLQCNQLKVNEMPLPVGKGQSYEVEASDNAVVEGYGVFTARGHRISYTKAKNLLKLEGDGRTNAELFRQLQPGAPFSRTTAQKFQYNIETGEINIINGGPMEINPGKN
jgi:hypothetical protein